jgi:hypothetical protein
MVQPALISGDSPSFIDQAVGVLAPLPNHQQKTGQFWGIHNTAFSRSIVVAGLRRQGAMKVKPPPSP